MYTTSPCRIAKFTPMNMTATMVSNAAAPRWHMASKSGHAMMTAMDEQPLAFVVHVGDFKSGAILIA